MNKFVLTLKDTPVKALLDRLSELGPIEFQYRGPIMYVETEASYEMIRALCSWKEDIMQLNLLSDE